MVKQKRVMAAILMAIMLMGVFAPTIYAQDNEKGVKIEAYKEDTTHITEAIKQGNKALGIDDTTSIEIIVKKVKTPLITQDGDGIRVNPAAFKDGNKKEVTKAMTGFVNSLKESGMPDDRQQAFMNEIQDIGPGVSAIMLPIVFEGTKGNIYKAYQIMGPMLDFLSDILGIGAILLIGLVLASSIADLAYIGLPMWREQQAESGKGGGKKPFMVSHEALSTVQEVEKSLGENYQNAYLLYFKRRAITYIVLAFCIMYLIGGQLSGIISFILNLASGITG